MVRRHQLGDEPWLDADLRVRKERGRFRMPVAAETEDGRCVPEPLGEVGERRNADAAADEQRPCDVEAEAVAERPEDRERVAGLQRRERAGARTDDVEQERELVRRRQTERHRPREEPARRLEHEELSWSAWVEAAAVDAQQRVRTDLLAADDVTPLASHARSVPAARATPPCARSRSRAPPRPRPTAS